MTVVQMSDEVKQFILGLNKLMALYEKHPDLPVPYLSDIYAFPGDREKLADAVRKTAYLKPKKDANDSWYNVSIQLSTKIKIVFCIDRGQVCERVKVGTKLLEVPERPAVAAHVEEVPQYEWKCADALLAPGVE
jgi:hypothetical protein